MICAVVAMRAVDTFTVKTYYYYFFVLSVALLHFQQVLVFIKTELIQSASVVVLRRQDAILTCAQKLT